MEILKCKITGKKFSDLKNKSGSITAHLKSININVPTSFIRRQFLKKEGKMWHLQYFDILESHIEKKKCKYCEWETIDLENKSGQYTSHLLNSHSKTIDSYINDFPEENILFKTFLDKKINSDEKLSSTNNFVVCKICGDNLKYITNSHLKKHNLTPEEYKIKFPGEKYACISFRKKTKKILEIATKNITKSFVSKPEKDLKEFIENELGIAIIKNDKKLLNGTEIDVLIPDLKIAIEFNGNLYHSENYGGKKRDFHLNKTEKCHEKGYKLIHIFEDEWFLRNSIIKSKLKHLLNINNNSLRIHARKCTVKEISANDKNLFLEKNHVQGYDKSVVHIGAFYEDTLISVMTFDNKRKMSIKNNSQEIYELKRFASDTNFIIPGIFSKILKYFIKNYTPSRIISFADRRWTINEDNLYTKSGFKLIKTLGPDYTYYNSKISRYKRFHKFSFGKSSLKNKFPEIYSDSKTEWEIMQEIGYDRIWDCGKFKYEMII